MPVYRIYPMTPNGKLLAPMTESCADDAEALAYAKGLPPSCIKDGYEVWQLGRLVGRFSPLRDEK